jgi:hypothetical protein
MQAIFGNTSHHAEIDMQEVHSKFVQFASLEYWSRAWITQEVLLAKRLVVRIKSVMYELRAICERCLALGLYGSWVSSGVPLPDIAFVQLTLNAFTHLPLGVLDPPTRPFARRTIAFLRLRSKNRSIVQALQHLGSEKGCTNVQDRIYTLLSLCAVGEGFRVDYSITTNELMRRTLEACKTSLCLCSVAVVAQSLQLPCWNLATSASAYIKFDAPDDELKSHCRTCNHYFHNSWLLGSSSIICLQSVCEQLSGHLVLRIHTSTDHQTDLVTHRVEYAPISCDLDAHMVLLTQVHGIDVSQARNGVSGTFRTWNLTFDALVYIVQKENEALSSSGKIRLCSSMSRLTGMPRASYEPKTISLRLCRDSKEELAPSISPRRSFRRRGRSSRHADSFLRGLGRH